MPKIKLSAKVEVVEINTYDFLVYLDQSVPEEERQSLAEKKIKDFVQSNCPNPYQRHPIDDVLCCDRESATETKEVQSIKIY